MTGTTAPQSRASRLTIIGADGGAYVCSLRSRSFLRPQLNATLGRGHSHSHFLGAMLAFPTPRVGDVIFTHSGGVDAHLSSIGQRLLDPRAGYSTPSFSHVSIVVNETCVLEATTAEDARDGDPPGGWGAWTGVELEAGVRVSPVIDSLVPAYLKGTNLAVLRRVDSTVAMRDALNVQTPQIAGIVGQAYALTALRESAEAYLPAIVTKALADNVFDWTSAPADIATMMGADAAFRERVRAVFPDYSLGFESRTYFCSELVAELLTLSGLAEIPVSEKSITPIGLFSLLTGSASGWTDVTETDYGRNAVECQMRGGSSSVATSYTITLAVIRVAQLSAATGKTLEFVERAGRRIGGIP